MQDDERELRVERDVPLALRTTLELGGAAEYFVEVSDEASIARALAWARERELAVSILGGGSNVVVSDAGARGLVVSIASRGIVWEERGRRVRVTAAAGEPWDPLVATTVARGLGGLECLSGIPGRVGAVPIQNVGAYGQEVSTTIVSVRVLDRASGEVTESSPEACAFAYRQSAFKRAPARSIVLAVSFELERDAAPLVAYDQLAQALERAGTPSSLASVRATVLALRRAKSMVIEPDDENRRSVGSFFVNPVVDASEAERVVSQALAAGLVAAPNEIPRWPADGGKVKLAAGWLVERAGFARGARRGAVGISTRHALALVHHGGGTSAALLALAREVRDGVQARFGVTLVPEPVALDGSSLLD